MPAAEEVTTVEVVPAAVEAHLDDVAGELLERRLELLELGCARDAAAVGLLEVAVHVGHEPHAVASAHRAVVGSALTDIPAGAEEFGVGVTHVATADRAAAQVPQDGSPCERVVDVSRHGAQCTSAPHPVREAAERGGRYRAVGENGPRQSDAPG